MSSHDKSAVIAVIMGSENDWPIMQSTTKILDIINIKYHVEIISAHRTPDKLFKFAENAEKNGYKVIIAGAGGAAHLPGMVASKTIVPVLGVPLQSTELKGIDSLCSILQMPYGIPVGTLAIGMVGASNAGLLAAQILAIYNKSIYNNLIKWRKEQTLKVINKSDPRVIT